MKKLGNTWDEFLEIETAKEYYKTLREFLKIEYNTKKIYPPMDDIFNALKLTPIEDVKVVILGQDPYINFGEAHGLAFSVQDGAKVPPSLQNIFKELHTDVECVIPKSGNLTPWAEQGVLLLNSVLTVEAGRSKTHSGKGWERFTTEVVKTLNSRELPMVFLLWGNDAKSKAELISSKQHLVLCASHPSPLARGLFFGCKHFSKANEFLEKNGLAAINWQL